MSDSELQGILDSGSVNKANKALKGITAELGRIEKSAEDAKAKAEELLKTKGNLSQEYIDAANAADSLIKKQNTLIKQQKILAEHLGKPIPQPKPQAKPQSKPQKEPSPQKKGEQNQGNSGGTPNKPEKKQENQQPEEKSEAPKTRSEEAEARRDELVQKKYALERKKDELSERYDVQKDMADSTKAQGNGEESAYWEKAAEETEKELNALQKEIEETASELAKAQKELSRALIEEAKPEKPPEKEPEKPPEKEPEKPPEKEPEKPPEKEPEKPPEKEPEKEQDEERVDVPKANGEADGHALKNAADSVIRALESVRDFILYDKKGRAEIALEKAEEKKEQADSAVPQAEAQAKDSAQFKKDFEREFVKMQKADSRKEKADASYETAKKARDEAKAKYDRLESSPMAKTSDIAKAKLELDKKEKALSTAEEKRNEATRNSEYASEQFQQNMGEYDQNRVDGTVEMALVEGMAATSRALQEQVDRDNQGVANAKDYQTEANADVNDAQANLAKVASTSEGVKSAIGGALGAVGGLAKGFVKATGAVLKFGASMAKMGLSKMIEPIKKVAGGFQNIGKRILGLAKRAVMFNIVSRGFRALTRQIGEAFKKIDEFRTGMANLKGAVAIAAAPLTMVLGKALGALANAFAKVVIYIAKFIAFLTGNSLGAMRAMAKQLGLMATNGGKAAKSLMGFDEINKLDDPGDAIEPNYNFDAQDEALDELLALAENGEWYAIGLKVGQMFSEGLEASIPAIEAAGEKLKIVATYIADFLTGFIDGTDFDTLGEAIATGLNVIPETVNEFFANMGFELFGMKLGEGMDKMVRTINWDALGKWFTNGWRMLEEILHGLVNSGFDFANLGASLSTMFTSAFDNILGDDSTIGEDLAKLFNGLVEAIVAFIETTPWGEMAENLATQISTFITTIDTEKVFAGIRTLWNKLLEIVFGLLAGIDWNGLGEWLGRGISSLCSNLIGLLGDLFAKAPGVIATLFYGLFAFLSSLLGQLLEDFGKWFTETFGDIGGFGIGGFFEGIGEAMKEAGKFIKEVIVDPIIDWVKDLFGIHSPSTVFAGFGDNLIQGLYNGISAAWASIKQFFGDAITKLKESVGEKFAAVKEKAVEIFEGLKTKLSEIWDGIWDKIKGVVNSILGGINGMVSGVVKGINAVIRALNSISFEVPSWVPIPGIAGQKMGFNLKELTAPEIPLLAQGAVIPPNKEFMAVLGDQQSGMNIEAPEGLIRQIMQDEMADMMEGNMAGFEAIVAVLRDILSAIYGIEIGDEVIGKAAQRYVQHQRKVRGMA